MWIFKWRDMPPLILFVVLWFISDASWGEKLDKFRWIGVILAVLAMLIRWQARMVIGKHTRTRQLEAPELAQKGIYRLSRNPLYMANILFALALVFWSGSYGHWASWLCAGLIMAHYHFLALKESEFLSQEWENQYQKYAHAVPLWVSFASLVVWRPVAFRFNIWWEDCWTWFWQILMFILLAGFW